MKYTIGKLNRIAILDDEIVSIYTQYRALRENPFVMRVISKYGYEPTAEELPEEEFSRLCNEVLLDEMELIAFIPEISKVIHKHVTELEQKGGKYYEEEHQKQR